MDTIVSGLQTYEQIKSIIGLITLIILFILAIIGIIYTYNLKYIKANNAKISVYKIINNTRVPCVNKTSSLTTNSSTIESTSSICEYYIEYDDENMNHYIQSYIPKSKSQIVGNVSLYYKKNDPYNYLLISFNPTLIPIVFASIIIIIIISNLVNLYFVRKYKEYGAFVGATNLIDSTFRPYNSAPIIYTTPTNPIENYPTDATASSWI